LNTRKTESNVFLVEKRRLGYGIFFEGCREHALHYVSLCETIFEKENQSGFSAMHQLVSCPELARMDAIQRLSVDQSRYSMIQPIYKPWFKI
jgi:hypothetical protein